MEETEETRRKRLLQLEKNSRERIQMEKRTKKTRKKKTPPIPSTTCMLPPPIPSTMLPPPISSTMPYSANGMPSSSLSGVPTARRPSHLV